MALFTVFIEFVPTQSVVIYQLSSLGATDLDYYKIRVLGFTKEASKV